MSKKIFFDTIYAYDTEMQTWIYDCKYYLKDGWWYSIATNEKAFECDDFQMQRMNELKKE